MPIGDFRLKHKDKPKNKCEARSRKVVLYLIIGIFLGLYLLPFVENVYKINLILGNITSALAVLVSIVSIYLVAKVPIKDDRFQTGYRGNAPKKLWYPIQLFIGCILTSGCLICGVFSYFNFSR